MRGGAITLARKFRDSGVRPDCILVTDMLDVPLLLSLIGKDVQCPVILYMHENQLTYPWSPIDPDPAAGRDHNYAFINYASCLVADLVLFNSHYHKSSFLDALPGFLNMFPDYRETNSIEAIRHKSQVLPLGLELHRFDAYVKANKRESKTILWNHRWEYDKDPELFFSVLSALSDEGFHFYLIVCGESTGTIPEVFPSSREKLQKHITHWGMVESFEEYARLLSMSDLIPVTSRQDFFGISVVEAMYCNVYPLLPDRLAFPEHIPSVLKGDVIYTDERDLLNKLRVLIQEDIVFDGKTLMGRYEWTEVISHYDEIFESLV